MIIWPNSNHRLLIRALSELRQRQDWCWEQSLKNHRQFELIRSSLKRADVQFSLDSFVHEREGKGLQEEEKFRRSNDNSFVEVWLLTRIRLTADSTASLHLCGHRLRLVRDSAKATSLLSGASFDGNSLSLCVMNPFMRGIFWHFMGIWWRGRRIQWTGFASQRTKSKEESAMTRDVNGQIEGKDSEISESWGLQELQANCRAEVWIEENDWTTRES